MRISRLAPWLSGLLLFSAFSASADTFCALHPTSPICSGEIVSFPVEAVPVEVDPCTSDPASCHVPGEDLPTFRRAELEGSGVMKGPGFHRRDDAAMTFGLLDDDRFALSLAPCKVVRGHALANAKGNKLTLFLDSGSLEIWEGAISDLAAQDMPEIPVVTGHTEKITVRLSDDGGAALKIKAELLLSGGAHLTYKADLSGELKTSPLVPTRGGVECPAETSR